MKTISKEYLDQHRTERGSWSMVQIRALGVKWPPPPGWRDAINGKQLTDEQAALFEAGKNVLSKKTVRGHVQQEVRAYEAAGLPIPVATAEWLLNHAAQMPPTSQRGITRAEKKAAKRAKQRAIRAGRPDPVLTHPARGPTKRAYVQPPPPDFRAPTVNPNSPEFLQSYEWRALRMKVLSHYGRACMCCGASPENSGEVMHVDHIKPRRLRPDLALDFNNLQVLCPDCNKAKGNKHATDYRPKGAPPCP